MLRTARVTQGQSLFTNIQASVLAAMIAVSPPFAVTAHAQNLPGRYIGAVASAQSLAAMPCAGDVVQRMQGQFFPGYRGQTLQVFRRQETSTDGPVCAFHVDIVGAEGGGLATLGEGTGPGRVFSDGYWHDPEMVGATFEARVVHLAPLVNDQVLIRHYGGGDDLTPIRVHLIGFKRLISPPETLLNIADVGRLDVWVEGRELVIRGLSTNSRCHLCGEMREIRLHFDPVGGVLALSSPTPENVAFFKDLVARGQTPD